jgi:hypothetical protein
MLLLELSLSLVYNVENSSTLSAQAGNLETTAAEYTGVESDGRGVVVVVAPSAPRFAICPPPD